MNSQDVSMLNNIYQNASMGIRGTQLLMEKTDDPQFSNTLHKFLVDYTKIKEQAADGLSNYQELPRDSGMMENAALWMGVQFNTLLDKTASHMAEMLIQGSTMDIIDSTKTLNTHKEISPQTKNLAESLIKIEKDNVQAMKEYLS